VEDRGKIRSKIMSTSNKTMYKWNSIPWRKLQRSVFKLQNRIYQASCRDDTQAVHKLQRLLLKSKSAAFIAVRRVAQDNKGKKTAGIDGLASLTAKQKLNLALKISKSPIIPKAKPVRRVWIPKPGKEEKRPLGIPVMEDRARQALVKMALEPEWEAKFEPHSYGFRPGRSCHDAMEAIHRYTRNVPKYVLDADISKCFDCINHEALLEKLGTFPSLRRMIKAWLKAGIVDDGGLFPVSEGTPQGGVISPLLANIALHGLETAIQKPFQKYKMISQSKRGIQWKPQVVRYADDFVIIHRDLEVLKRAKQVAEEWLKDMGLEIKPSKTRITHTLKEADGPIGFDFLGFNFRLYPRGKTRSTRDAHGNLVGFVEHVKPSKESQKRLLRKTREIMRSNRNVAQAGLIGLLNPVIRGWGNYYSTVVSKDIFSKMDILIFRQLWSWAKRRHPNKNRRWVAKKYWQMGQHGWKFGRMGQITLHRLSDVPIWRHKQIQKHRSPYDGDVFYWSSRMGNHPLVPKSFAALIKFQKGYCPKCGLFFKPGDSVTMVRTAIDATGQPGKARLVHQYCQGSSDNRCVMTAHRFTEEPDERKLSRPVLKTSANREVRA